MSAIAEQLISKVDALNNKFCNEFAGRTDPEKAELQQLYERDCKNSIGNSSVVNAQNKAAK